MRLSTRKPISKWDLAIGEKIREAREARHMSQGQLAEQVHVSQGNISDFEHGVLQVNALDLFIIANALGKPAAYFVPHPFYGPTQEGELSRKAQELFHFIYQIPDEARRDKVLDLLIEHARGLAEVIAEADIAANLAEIEAGLTEKQKARAKK
jgi:transcriptional regulator with XRE-family HTH domain